MLHRLLIILVMTLFSGCTQQDRPAPKAPIVYLNDGGNDGFQPYLLKNGQPHRLTVFRPVKQRRPGFFPAQSIAYNNLVLFEANEADLNNELWKTDGTAKGTVLVKDVNPRGRSNPAYLTPFNERIFFRAYSAEVGDELWSTDGSETGTVRHMDHQGNPVLYPAYLTVYQDRLYFRAQSAEGDAELWSSDGTAEGTQRVKDLLPGTGQGNPAHLCVFNDELWFTATDANAGTELWRSDGTEAGTRLAYDLNPGMGGSYPSELTTVEATLYFVARNTDGAFGLWRYSPERAPAPLTMPTELNRKRPFKYLTLLGDRLFFIAYSQTGSHVYMLDGERITEVQAFSDAGLERPLALFAQGDRLFAGGSSSTYGDELFVLEGDTVRVIDHFPGTDSGLSIN